MERRPKPDLAVPVGERDHTRGLATAAVTLVEYGDYECPYSQKALLVVEALEHEFGDRLRFVFRHFPRTVIHRYAQHAAEAAEAAHAQGYFWQMHRHLLEPQWNLDQPSLVHYAMELGLDPDKFERGLRNRSYRSPVEEDLLTAVASGVESTPSFFINGMQHKDGFDLATMRTALLKAEEQARQRA